MIIYATRHTETEWNKLSINQGHLDSPLTKKGVAVAHDVGRKLKDEQFDGFYSSDLGRCVATSRIVSGYVGMTAETTADLRERNFGIYNGRLKAELRQHLDASDWQAAPPGGESLQQTKARVERFLATLNDPKTLIVTHSGVVNILLAATTKEQERKPSSQGLIYVLELMNGSLSHRDTF